MVHRGESVVLLSGAGDVLIEIDRDLHWSEIAPVEEVVAAHKRGDEWLLIVAPEKEVREIHRLRPDGSREIVARLHPIFDDRPSFFEDGIGFGGDGSPPAFFEYDSGRLRSVFVPPAGGFVWDPVRNGAWAWRGTAGHPILLRFDLKTSVWRPADASADADAAIKAAHASRMLPLQNAVVAYGPGQDQLVLLEERDGRLELRCVLRLPDTIDHARIHAAGPPDLIFVGGLRTEVVFLADVRGGEWLRTGLAPRFRTGQVEALDRTRFLHVTDQEAVILSADGEVRKKCEVHLDPGQDFAHHLWSLIVFPLDLALDLVGMTPLAYVLHAVGLYKISPGMAGPMLSHALRSRGLGW